MISGEHISPSSVHGSVVTKWLGFVYTNYSWGNLKGIVLAH